MQDPLKNMDVREIELPETAFVRDIETRVFQAIALQCLSKIEGIGLVEGGFFGSLLGRDLERVKGVYVQQDQNKHAVDIRIEIRVRYGISIPEKAEEIQTKVAEEVSAWTGLHVSSVHVIFKDLLVEPSTSAASAPTEFEEAF